jgi:ankyrin repeat protein
LGFAISHLFDESFRHNSIFYATLIKDDITAVKMVNYLITQAVDPTAHDTLSQTPLFYASRDGKPNLVEVLLKHGCQPNQLDTYGQTPIFYAAREGHVDVCKRLV